MEQLFGTEKMDIFTDPLHRMSQRPSTVKSGQGVGFQELGSTFGSSKTVVNTYGRSSKSQPKPAESRPPKPRDPLPRVVDEESDDELLLSSQNSMPSDATFSTKRVAKGKKASITSDEVETVRVNGRLFPAHPNFKPSSYDAVKGLRFTKNKQSAPAGDGVAEIPPPSSPLGNSQDLHRPISDDIEILDAPPPAPSSSRPKPSETRLTGPSATRTTHRLPHIFNQPSAAKATPRSPTKLRPRPRIVKRSPPPRHDHSPESTPRPIAQKPGLPLHNKIPELPTNAKDKRVIEKPPFPSPLRREPQEFPMSLQAKENVSDGARSGDASSSKTKKPGIPRSVTYVNTPKPIPLPSPLGTRRSSRGTTFPNLSPLHSSQDKGKARVKFPDENATPRSGLEPFPMDSQMFAGIDRRSKSPTNRSPISTKRASSEGSCTEQGRDAKKHKDSRLGMLDTFDYWHTMEDDSLELGYAQDPSKLCPYCDEELPLHPTPLLQHLLATARKRSVSDPRPRNRGGLKAPLTIYISACQRHRFESHQLPIAVKRGWPQTIDFSKVPARVKKMRKELEAIIMEKDDISDTEDFSTSNRPRNKSVIWREVKKQVKKQGSRTVVGVKGQFASFEKAQPGYYGEQGSVIIHQTLFDLFPPSTFDASLIAPLAPAEFIQRILVPEAAVRLIAQDLSVDMQDALVTLRDSAQYGVAMFPDTSENKLRGAGGDDDEMGVADKIVMERARARRKELAEEERVEKAMMKEERAAHLAKVRESQREKAVKRAKQARLNVAGEQEEEDTSEMSEAGATRRTRRVARQLTIAQDSESDAMSVDSLASRRPVRVAKKGVRVDGGKTVRATPRPDLGSDNDSMPLFGDPRFNTSKTKKQSTEPDTRVKPKKTFIGFTSLDGDGESTPRPARKRTDAKKAVDIPQPGMLPLEIARKRVGASGDPACDGWSRSLRTTVPNEDSDESDASRGSRRLVRRPIKTRKEYSWLLNNLSSPELSSS